MHKTFYASGFLYHPVSQQILLQQNSTLPSPSWTLFGGTYLEGEEPEKIFKKNIFALLHVKIDHVHPVYSYADESADINQLIVYAELQELQDFPPKKGLIFAWFSFKDILKLRISVQTKHDIVVGQRVIDAASRKSRGEHTFQ